MEAVVSNLFNFNFESFKFHDFESDKAPEPK